MDRLVRYIPWTVKKRQLVLNSLVKELDKRGFPHKKLDESYTSKDFEKVVQIVSEMCPANNSKTVHEYSWTVIRLWNQKWDEKT